MSDEEIIKRVRAGQFDEFGTLVERYAGLVWGLTASYVRNREDCADVAQEVLVLAFKRLDTLRDPKAFGAWLSQLARRHCLTWLRSQMRRRAAHDQLQSEAPEATGLAEESPADVLAREERYAHIRASVDALPPSYREALNLYYMEGFDHGQAAAFLGIRPAAFRKRLQVGRAKLREQMERDLRPALEGQKHDTKFTAGVLAAIPLSRPPWADKPIAAHANSATLPAATGIPVVKAGSWLIAGVICLFAAWALTSRLTEPETTVASGTGGAENATASERASAPPRSDALIDTTETASAAQVPMQQRTVGSETAPIGKNHHVSGRVVWDDQTPFAGATIELDQSGNPAFTQKLHATTDAAGLFFAENLYNVHVRMYIAPSDDWHQADIVVEPDTDDNLLTVHRKAYVSGQVIDAHTGKPIRNIHALAHHENVQITNEGTPFEDGNFELAAPVGLCVVRVRAEGYADTRSKPFKSLPGKTATISIPMSPESRILGHVLDARTRTPVAGATVVATTKENVRDAHFTNAAEELEQSRPLFNMATSGPDGRFSIRQLPAGKQYLFVQHSDYPNAKAGEISVGAVETKEGVMLFLQPGKSIAGVVRRNGEPVTGACVTADAPDGGFTYSMVDGALTDAEGRYKIEQVAGTKVILRARATLPGGAVLLAEQHVDLPPHGSATADIELPFGERYVRGVAYLRGMPKKGLHILLAPGEDDAPVPSPLRCRIETSADGRFEFGPLPAGVYQVHAQHYGGLGPQARRDTVDENLRDQAVVDAREGDIDTVFHLGTAETGTIVGTVYENHEPTPGVTVVVSQKGENREEFYYAKVVTNLSGTYTFDGAPLGEIKLEMRTADDRDPLPARFVFVEAGGNYIEDFRFATGSGSLHVAVFQDDEELDLAEIEDLSIMVRLVGGTNAMPVSERNSLTITDLPPGIYDVMLHMNIHGREHLQGRTVEIVDDKANSVVVRLHTEGAQLTGVIPAVAEAAVDKPQQAVAGLFASGASTWAPGEYQETGNIFRLGDALSMALVAPGEPFTFEGVQPGHYDVVAAWFEGTICTNVSTASVEVTGGEQAPVELSFE